ncbi:hypothetical protein HDV05_002004 [Chytridiales sp. JEL 0842]|nr:hypothetical protein HDV05_002004 [Chytridiales sp. JEL 0842]
MTDTTTTTPPPPIDGLVVDTTVTHHLESTPSPLSDAITPQSFSAPIHVEKASPVPDTSLEIPTSPVSESSGMTNAASNARDPNMSAYTSVVDPISITVDRLRVYVKNPMLSNLTTKKAKQQQTGGTPRFEDSSVDGSVKKGVDQQSTLDILSDVNIHVPAGKLMAIMGGSGSGKTTLLNVLAGRPIGNVEGSITFNNRDPKYYIRKGAVAYVQQQDTLLPYLTVRQTLQYAARLRLPSSMSTKEKYELVESVILELGLKECANVLIGDEWRKGISGGEKRRVSVGTQLLLNPRIIFLDEPTTGLDSAAALSLVQTLSHLTTKGRTIVVSIHQPRSDIFNAFSHITLLTRGRLAYSGERMGAIQFFEKLGLKVVGNMNGADFLIDMTHIDDRTLEAEKETRARVEMIVQAWKVESLALTEKRESPTDPENPTDPQPKSPPAASPSKSFASPLQISPGASFFEQVSVLTSRSLANLKEDRLALYGSILEVLVVGTALGLIYYKMEETPAGIQGRKALLYSVCALQNYLGLMFIIWKLSSEMVVFDRERADKMYTVSAYLVSWLTVNLTLYGILAVIFSTIIYFMSGLRTDNLGYHFGYFALFNILLQYSIISMSYVCVSIKRDFATASLIGNSLFTFLSMSSGFFIPIDIIPVYLRWLKYIDFITFGYRGLASLEFSNRVFECKGLPPGIDICNGQSILASLQFSKDDVQTPVLALVIIVLVQLVLTQIILVVLPVDLVKQAGRVSTGSESEKKKKEVVEGAEVSVEIEEGDDLLGKQKQVVVELKGLSLSYVKKPPTSKAPTFETPILRSVSAKFEAGKLTAILGASGAGKSTLLHLLHGREHRLATFVKSVQTGKLLHNGQELSEKEIGSLTASVRQDDSHLLPALTARETLRYAALLRLPNSWTRERKEKRAEDVLRELGLTECGNTLVGGAGLKGLSGGEKRRLSPRSDLFPLFDNILLLARGGRVVYQGPGQAMIEHFGNLGFPVPALSNPADFALDLSSVDLRGEEVELYSRGRVDKLIEEWKKIEGSIAAGSEGGEKEDDVSAQNKKAMMGGVATARMPIWRALPLLVSRSFLNLRRQPALIAARIAQSAAFAVILTLYFVNMKTDQPGVTTRIGFMQQSTALVFIGMLNCLSVFPQELKLFVFEFEDGVYSVESFFWTYTLNEVPFEIFGSILFAILSYYAIGIKVNIALMSFVVFALVNCGESIGIAFCTLISQPGFSVQLMSSLISIMNLMAGFLSIDMPQVLLYLNHISIMRYVARVIAKEGFEGVEFSCDDPAFACQFRNGTEVLNFLKFPLGRDAYVEGVVGALVTLLVYRLVAYLVMKVRI